MRVRSFELRLIALALLACWTLTALVVLLVYRPGGPVDLLVGLAAGLPIVIALAALAWPPVANGARSFPAMIWLGLGALLVLVPSIGGLTDQLLRGGSQTLMPTVESAYPWALALLGTSLFAGYGIARRTLGETAMRQRRLVHGTAVAVILAIGTAAAFTAVAMANELALRDRLASSSRFGPTDPELEPPACDARIVVGRTARLELHLAAEVDGRPLGRVDLSGARSSSDFRWLAYVATGRELGFRGAAKIADRAWVRPGGSDWAAADLRRVADSTIDLQAMSAALTQSTRAAAEEHGLAVVEGARARQCRVAVDGETFRRAFPEVDWLVGDASLERWRGELDYWVFADGEIGRVAGNVSGDAVGIRDDALQATVRVDMVATSRGADHAIVPPR